MGIPALFSEPDDLAQLTETSQFFWRPNGSLFYHFRLLYFSQIKQCFDLLYDECVWTNIT